jgi:hypothetical protein
MPAEACLARPAARLEARMHSRLRRRHARKVVPESVVRRSLKLARSEPSAGSYRAESVACTAAVGRFARVASRSAGGGNSLLDSHHASPSRRALPNPSLEARPSEATRFARASKSVIIAHPGKAARLCGPAQLER